MVASFRKKSFKFWSSSLPSYVYMVGGKGGCTFATVKCLLLVVIWPFFLCGFNFSCSWRHWFQISQIRVWSARNDATSDNSVLPIIKCPPVQLCFIYYILYLFVVELFSAYYHSFTSIEYKDPDRQVFFPPPNRWAWYYTRKFLSSVSLYICITINYYHKHISFWKM